MVIDFSASSLRVYQEHAVNNNYQPRLSRAYSQTEENNQTITNTCIPCLGGYRTMAIYTCVTKGIKKHDIPVPSANELDIFTWWDW